MSAEVVGYNVTGLLLFFAMSMFTTHAYNYLNALR